VLAAWLTLWATPLAGAAGWSQPADIGSWSDPGEPLEGGGRASDSLIEFQFPRLAVSPNGMAVAVWEDFSLSGGIFAAVRRPGQTSWQPPARIAPGGRNPAVAVGAHGDVVVVWQQQHAPLASAFLPSRSDRWDAPVILPGVQDASIPHVAIDSRGNAVAAWVDMPPALREGGPGEPNVEGFVQSAVRDSRSGVWSKPAALTNVHRGSVETVANDDFDIAMDANGDAVVAWVQSASRNREPGVAAAAAVTIDSRVHKAATGRWLATEMVARLGDSANPLSMSLAVAPSGAAFVAWEVHLNRTSAHPFENRSLIRGAIHVPWHRSWGRVETVAGAMGRESGAPAIAIDSRGTATAVWNAEVENGEGSIEGSTRTALGRRWAPFGVVGHGMSPRLAADGRGDLATSWESGFYNHAELVQGAVRPTGGAWQAPTLLFPTNRRSDRPTVALDSSGEAFVVAWERGGVVAAACGGQLSLPR
jgi:hypothetical protein